MNTEVQSQRQLEMDLREALRRQDFRVAYQPRVDISTGRLVGAEALLRWRSSSRGQVSPAEFIPVAETAGLIVPITEWLLRVVCGQNKEWQRQGLPPICVSVNLSPVHFKDRELVGQVKKALSDTGLAAEWLELEIIEGIAMEGGAATLDTLVELKTLGVRLSIDDFGTGYSSLNRLKRFPVDHLKIDQSFVRDITTDPNDAAICSAAISLAHSMNIGVVAEGVETAEQRAFLAEQGCDQAQGYFFGQPVDAGAFGDILRRGSASPPSSRPGKPVISLARASSSRR